MPASPILLPPTACATGLPMSARHHDDHHGHHHSHHLVAQPHGLAFPLAVLLNLAFVIAEIAAGVMSGSMALLADAGPNFSDVLSLLLAWGAWGKAWRLPGRRQWLLGLARDHVVTASGGDSGDSELVVGPLVGGFWPKCGTE